MDFREIKIDEWDKFITAQNKHTFLHSWAWGKLNKALGEKIWYLGVFENEEIISAILVIKVNARRGNFLFVPQGPVTNAQKVKSKKELFESIIYKLKEIAKKEGDIVFIRISPLLKDTEENNLLFKKLGLRNAPIYMHAETTWQLDLNKDEKELMMGMRKNTRNLIRKAQKEEVKIVSGTSDEYIHEFLALYSATAKKQGFVPFSKKYIQEELNSFEGDAKIYLARWQGKTLSTALIVNYGSSAFYHHGANALENRKIPAGYLLQWQAILDAKKQGRAYYNFWGIAKNDENKSHPWHGLSFFKKGFGGYRTDYLHAQDLPLSWRYLLTYIIEKIRLYRRGV